MKRSLRLRLTSVFQRVTTSGTIIQEIDGLRFICLLGVLVVHIYTNYLDLIPTGRLTGLFPESGVLHLVFSTAGRGVELFFMISGFILALPFLSHYQHQGKTVSLKKYFKRRLLRLEPPYIVAMTLFFLLRYFPLHPALEPNPGTPNLIGSLLASLAYIHNIVYGHNSYINGVAWSLEVEVQFYIMAPWLAGLIFPCSRPTRIGIYTFVFCAAPVLQYILEVHLAYPLENSRKSIIGNIQFFLMGFAIADLYMERVFLRLPAGANILAGSILLVTMFVVPIRECFPLPRAIFLGAASLFYWLVLSPGFWQQLLRSTPFVLIGGMCYTVYLIHFPLMLLLSKLAVKLFVTDLFLVNFALHFCLVATGILLVSSIFYLLIEKPCMRPDWPSELWRHLRGESNQRPVGSPQDALHRDL
jgi:peptidoglycan/LPS O-acetylase OafA/YrhL